jgi:hypothetical protein
MEFDNPSEEKLFVIDANLQRRQLNQVQKVQLCLKKKAIMQEISKQHMSMSGKGVKVLTPLKRINEVIAKEAGCSAFQVHKIETVLTKAPEQLKLKVIDGRVKVDNAYNFVKQEDERNRLIVEAQTYCNRSESGTELGIQNPNLASFKLVLGDIREAPTHNAIKPESVRLIFTDLPYAESELPLYKYLAKLAERVLEPGFTHHLLQSNQVA